MIWHLIKRYVRNVAVAVDQLLSALTGGDPDETISSRLGKAQRRGQPFACIACRLLDLIQRNHCARSIEDDEGDKAGA